MCMCLKVRNSFCFAFLTTSLKSKSQSDLGRVGVSLLNRPSPPMVYPPLPVMGHGFLPCFLILKNQLCGSSFKRKGEVYLASRIDSITSILWPETEFGFSAQNHNQLPLGSHCTHLRIRSLYATTPPCMI